MFLFIHLDFAAFGLSLQPHRMGCVPEVNCYMEIIKMFQL